MRTREWWDRDPVTPVETARYMAEQTVHNAGMAFYAVFKNHTESTDAYEAARLADTYRAYADQIEEKAASQNNCQHEVVSVDRVDYQRCEACAMIRRRHLIDEDEHDMVRAYGPWTPWVWDRSIFALISPAPEKDP